VTDGLGAELGQGEVDAFDQCVDAGRGRAERLGDRGVVAGADSHPRPLAGEDTP
jgi:hypothetical protein